MHFVDLEDLVKTPKTVRLNQQQSSGKDISLVRWSHTQQTALASSVRPAPPRALCAQSYLPFSIVLTESNYLGVFQRATSPS